MLQSIQKRNGAVFDENIAVSFGDVVGEYHSAYESVSILSMPKVRRISIQGPDRVLWFHGMTTQNIKALKEWESALACVCSIKGKVLGVGHVDMYPERIIFETPSFGSDAWYSQLERLLIMEDAELSSEEVSYSVSLFGVGLNDLINSAFSRSYINNTVFYHNDSCIRFGMFNSFPRLDIHSNDLDFIEEISRSARWIGHLAYEQHRIESGMPAYGVDITDSNFPQEAGLERALSFDKGCYVGQETVAKIHFRGHVNRKLWVLRSDEKLSPSSIIYVSGQEKGIITSSCYSETQKTFLSLGYLRRECFESEWLSVISEGTELVAHVVSPAAL